MVLETWPEESKEAATLVIHKYGEPVETTDSLAEFDGLESSTCPMEKQVTEIVGS